MPNNDYPEYGGCDSCEHQNEICTDCMQRNGVGDWVHSKYSPKPGVYVLPHQKQVTTTLITNGSAT